MARDKHENSYGEYFLFDTFDEAPVYQHFAGKVFKLLIKIYPFLVNFAAANPEFNSILSQNTKKSLMIEMKSELGKKNVLILDKIGLK